MHAGKFALRAAVFAALLVWVQAAGAQGPANLDNATCLGCHGVTGFAAPRADGKSRSLFVAADHFADSVHGKASIRCVDCHTTITALPHTNVSKTAAAWKRTKLAIARNCINCHAAAAQGYLETYHGQVVAMGFANGATCADCHGSHAILPRQQSGLKRSAGQPIEDLPEVSCRRDGWLRDVPAARHNRRLRALSLHMDRLEIREYGGRRRAGDLLERIRRFGSIANIATASSGRRARMCAPPRCHRRKAAITSVGAPCGAGLTCCLRVSIILLVATGVTLLYPNTAWAPVLETRIGRAG